MTASGDDERSAALLAECLREPARGLKQLPAVVGLVEAEDTRTRLAAAWACCLICTEYPDSAPYVVRRLADRLDGEVSLELTHALDYLADRYPETVSDVMREVAEVESGGGRRDSWPRPETGNFTRNYIYETEPTRSGIGRIRRPGSADVDDPRRVYTASEPADSPQFEDEPESTDAETSGDGEASDTGTGNDASQSDTESGELVRRTSAVSAIAARSRFDRLHVLASQYRGRYSEDYDALVGRGADEAAIALRLLHLPEDTGARPDFEAAADERLAAWAAVDDHPHVVSLLDWGGAPRPWLATSFAGESLVELGERSPPQALHDAITLADAVAHCHNGDVVHGGLDPRNVAYPGDVLEENDQEPPLLNNVGFVGLYRRYTNPVQLLDPRYAAPEYFDRRFGAVDAATDVYGLGALVYRLYTGEPPVTGTFESVKSAITGPETPVPGEVDSSVPGAVDDIVAKAMATAKLRRYDTVEHLHQELVGLQEDGLA